MEKKKFFVTSAGLAELKNELHELEKVKRPEVLERVSKAREMGDLAENSEYHAAREELSLIDGRIEELQEIMKHVQIIKEEKSNGGGVKLGSKVSLHIDGKKKDVFTIVGEWEADPRNKKISHESPIGKALMGKGVGEEVIVEAPAGKITYTVLEVE